MSKNDPTLPSLKPPIKSASSLLIGGLALFLLALAALQGWRISHLSDELHEAEVSRGALAASVDTLRAQVEAEGQEPVVPPSGEIDPGVEPTSPVVIHGRDGEDGEDGQDGEPGPPGETGAQGPAGSTGERGAQGPPGDTTSPSADAILAAVTAFCTGDPSPCAGPQGAPGEQGPAGPAGPAGQNGEPGATGVSVTDVESVRNTDTLRPTCHLVFHFSDGSKVTLDNLRLPCS